MGSHMFTDIKTWNEFKEWADGKAKDVADTTAKRVEELKAEVVELKGKLADAVEAARVAVCPKCSKVEPKKTTRKGKKVEDEQ